MVEKKLDFPSRIKQLQILQNEEQDEQENWTKRGVAKEGSFYALSQHLIAGQEGGNLQEKTAD